MGGSEGFLNAVPCDARCQRWKDKQNPFDCVDEITAVGLQMFEWQVDHPLPRVKPEEETEEEAESDGDM